MNVFFLLAVQEILCMCVGGKGEVEGVIFFAFRKCTVVVERETKGTLTEAFFF